MLLYLVSGLEYFLLLGSTADDLSLHSLLETSGEWRVRSLDLSDHYRDWLGLFPCHAEFRKCLLPLQIPIELVAIVGRSTGRRNLHPMGTDGGLCFIPTSCILSRLIETSTVCDFFLTSSQFQKRFSVTIPLYLQYVVCVGRQQSFAAVRRSARDYGI